MVAARRRLENDSKSLERLPNGGESKKKKKKTADLVHQLTIIPPALLPRNLLQHHLP